MIRHSLNYMYTLAELKQPENLGELRNVRGLYANILSDILPGITHQEAEGAIRVLNVFRPSDWTFSGVPAKILGRTHDAHVLYEGEGDLAMYFVAPYSDVHRSILHEIEKKRADLQRPLPEGAAPVSLDNVIKASLRANERLLAELEALGQQTPA